MPETVISSSREVGELLAVVYCKATETRVKRTHVESVVRLFQEDWSSSVIVEVDNRLNETIYKVILFQV
jgi:hypothetical protein